MTGFQPLFELGRISGIAHRNYLCKTTDTHTEALVKRKKRCRCLFWTQEVRQNISEATSLSYQKAFRTFRKTRPQSKIVAFLKDLLPNASDRETPAHRNRSSRPQKHLYGAQHRMPLGKSCFQPSVKGGNIAPFSRTAAGRKALLFRPPRL
jgi:hypothetical protein